MNRKNIFAGALLLAGFFLATDANAYKYFKCGGVKVVWSNPFAMVQNTFSIPFGGPREGSLENGINRWRGVIGMEDMVSKSGSITTGSTIWHFNFQNDVAVVPRPSIGANGAAMMFHDGCFFGGDMEWIEVDVMAANDLGFGKVPETDLIVSGRSTFIHEFGHAHGLDHAQLFNNMRVPQPRPVMAGPGETVDVLPDDAKGGRFLYPTGNDEINLFTSAHRRKASNDTILVNNPGTKTVCSKGGDSLTILSTVGNNGTVDMQQTERWWVSTSKQAHNGVGGTKIGEWKNGTFIANTVHTRELTFKLPALPAGTYFLYHGVDMLDEHNESREDDNAVREALTLKVNNC